MVYPELDMQQGWWSQARRKAAADSGFRRNTKYYSYLFFADTDISDSEILYLAYVRYVRYTRDLWAGEEFALAIARAYCWSTAVAFLISSLFTLW